MQQSIMQYSDKQIATIRKTVAVGATNEELDMFLTLSLKYGLDPLAREIWFVQTKTGKNLIMTGRDGYLKIANSNPHYQGLNSDVVYEHDKFEKKNNFVVHQYQATERGKIIGAYAFVFRDDRIHPAYFFAPMRDYFKDNSTVWKNYSHAMILKVAEAMALKRAFSISGLVTVEEVDDGEQKRARIWSIWNRFLAIYKKEDFTIDKIQSYVGVRPSSTWTENDMAELEEVLDTLENEVKMQNEVIEVGEV